MLSNVSRPIRKKPRFWTRCSKIGKQLYQAYTPPPKRKKKSPDRRLSARRPGQRFNFLQCRGSLPSLHFVNRHGGTLRRAGWVAFTKTYSRGKWLILHLPPTFSIIIIVPASPASLFWSHRVPVPHVPASHTWCPHVPVPVSPSHFYTQPVRME